MSVRYQSDYANQVHQLVISVSRHLWVGKDGVIRYQHKAFDVGLAKLSTSPKRHVIHYLLRDHFSGALYAEIAVSPELPHAREFLLRAWSRKDHLSFCGIPALLTVPKTVITHWPDVVQWIHELGPDIMEATSGFQAGIRDLKTWEDKIQYSIATWYPPNDLLNLPALAEVTCREMTDEFVGSDRPHIQRWRAGLRRLRLPIPEDGVVQAIGSDTSRRAVEEHRSAYFHAFAERVGIPAR
jgi:hypothetical protein